MFKLILCFFLGLTKAEITVTFLAENTSAGPYRTTRFSELIGTFPSTCSISSRGIAIPKKEDPCKRNLIETDVTGLVVFAFFLETRSCYPEQAYENLEQLGAVAVVNVGKRPAGSNMYISHFGYPIGKGSIPFLDTSLEFFENVYLEMLDTAEDFDVEINGCDDENQFQFCFEVTDLISIWSLIPFAVFNIVASRKSLQELLLTKGTAPRIFILQFFQFMNYSVLIFSFANLTAFDTYFWITDGKFAGFSFFLWNYFMLLLLPTSVSPNIKSSTYGIYGLCFIFAMMISLEALGITSVMYFLQKPGSGYFLMPILFMITDGLISIIFLFANTVFLFNVVNVLEEGVELRSPNSRISCFTKFTGFGLDTYLDKNSIQMEGVSFGTFHLVAHLSKWLFRFTGIFIVIIIYSATVIDHLLFYGDYEDTESVKYCLLSLTISGVLIPKLLMVYCLIRGVSGARLRNPRQGSVQHFLRSN
eukprot:snap_masked-scaffold_13-processed-gene-11.37-mRNA-1 protein AED:1.00 eAED:1.00 QI:0/0/0/0/1/1/4/0/474